MPRAHLDHDLNLNRHGHNPTIRRQIRARRNGLTLDEQQRAATQLCHQFFSSPLLSSFVTGAPSAISLYLANDGEIDTSFLIHKFWRLQHQVYMPVMIDQDPLRPLQFQRYTDETVLLKNQFNIQEPLESELIDRSNIDIFFLPLVAFDKQCNRLGRGGGYYDRTLHDYLADRAHSDLKKAILIGVAHDCQLNESFQVGEYDIPLDFVLTPSLCYQRNKS